MGHPHNGVHSRGRIEPPPPTSVAPRRGAAGGRRSRPARPWAGTRDLPLSARRRGPCVSPHPRRRRTGSSPQPGHGARPCRGRAVPCRAPSPTTIRSGGCWPSRASAPAASSALTTSYPTRSSAPFNEGLRRAMSPQDFVSGSVFAGLPTRSSGRSHASDVPPHVRGYPGMEGRCIPPRPPVGPGVERGRLWIARVTMFSYAPCVGERRSRSNA